MEEKTNIFALTKQDTAVLKGIAIVAMLMHHLWGCAPGWAEPYTGVLGFLGSVGKVCVAIFLFCSGYGLSVGYSKVMEDGRFNNENWKNRIKTTLKFLAKRFVKFYSGYWPIFLIFVPISIFGFGRSLSDAYGADVNVYQYLLTDVLGVGGFYSYNITWWFNALIIGLYLLFPVIYFIGNKTPWLLLLLSLLIVRLGGRGWSGMLPVFMLYQMPFVFGVLWKRWEFVGDKFRGNNWLVATCCVLVLIVAILCRELELIPHWSGARMDGLLTIAMAGLVIVCRKLIHFNNVLAYCGKHSMNTYLTHTFFVEYWFKDWFLKCEVGGGMD